MLLQLLRLPQSLLQILPLHCPLPRCSLRTRRMTNTPRFLTPLKTVSRKADGSEYYLECNFYGDDQMTRTTYDGSEFTILEDKTGFMGGNTPDILKKAIEQNIWLPIAK